MSISDACLRFDRIDHRSSGLGCPEPWHLSWRSCEGVRIQRRTMTAWEMEAQRDREHFKRVLAQLGQPGLQQAMRDSLTRQAERPQLDVRVVRRRAVSGVAVSAEHTAQFAFLKFPDAPVEPLDGWAELSGNEAHSPRIQVHNLSNKSVKYVELAWLVSGQKGHQYIAPSRR